MTRKVSPKRAIEVKPNFVITNDPCAFCGGRCDPSGLDYFAQGTWTLVCDQCAESINPLLCDERNRTKMHERQNGSIMDTATHLHRISSIFDEQIAKFVEDQKIEVLESISSGVYKFSMPAELAQTVFDKVCDDGRIMQHLVELAKRRLRQTIQQAEVLLARHADALEADPG
jgi:hypothetical protein